MNSRDRILDAAADILHHRGLASATTKEIARAAGVAEGTLYKQFRDKEELLGQVLFHRFPQFIPAIKELHEHVGRGTVRGNLVRLAGLALEFFHAAMPMSASMIAEPALLVAQRAAAARYDAGPHRANEAVAGYLRAEQERGRVRAGADPRALADLLLGGCFQQAYLQRYAGTEPTRARRTRLAGTLVDGLAL